MHGLGDLVAGGAQQLAVPDDLVAAQLAGKSDERQARG